MAFIRFYYTKYKLSKLATFISAIGGIFISLSIVFTIYGAASGFTESFSEDTIGLVVCGLIMLGMGLGFQKWAKSINDKKVYQKWTEVIAENNLAQQASANTAVALELYKKAPTERCRNYILQLNPGLNGFIQSSAQAPQPNQQAVTPPAPVYQKNAQQAPVNTPPVQQAGGFCRNCGSRVAPNSRFCNNCGASVVY